MWGGGGGQGGTINTKQERFDGTHEASPEKDRKKTIDFVIASPHRKEKTNVFYAIIVWIYYDQAGGFLVRSTEMDHHVLHFGSSVCHKLENSIPSAAFLCNFPDHITDGISQCDEAGFMPIFICWVGGMGRKGIYDDLGFQRSIFR